MLKRSIMLLLAVGLFVFSWSCMLFLDGFQAQMGEEGKFLEALSTVFFLFQSYKFLTFIHSKKELE